MKILADNTHNRAKLYAKTLKNIILYFENKANHNFNFDFTKPIIVFIISSIFCIFDN